jgi:site-specific recombinase XerC
MIRVAKEHLRFISDERMISDDHRPDVQMLAGHAALSTTQRYIEADVDAQRRIVDLV